MIDVKELRIGNNVELTIKGKTHKTKIDYLDIAMLSGCTHFIRPTGLIINPIPLSEKRLVEWDFVDMNEGGGWIAKWGFNGSTSIDDGVFAWICGDSVTMLKYEHQLQNLYFALTNKELQTK